MPLVFIANQVTSLARRVGSPSRLAPHDVLLIVRWIVLALLLALALLEPEPTRIGVSAAGCILLFAAYSLPIDLLGRQHVWIRQRLQPALDLAVAGTLYLLNSRFDGAIYTLLILVVVSAVTVLSPRAALLYVVITMLIMVGLELILRHPWEPEVILLDVGPRMLRLALVGFVAALLARRLTLEQLATHRANLEAAQFAELDRLRGNFVAAVSHACKRR